MLVYTLVNTIRHPEEGDSALFNVDIQRKMIQILRILVHMTVSMFIVGSYQLNSKRGGSCA